jgi:hypothetical protein
MITGHRFRIEKLMREGERIDIRVVTSLHGWRTTYRAGKYEEYLDFKRLPLLICQVVLKLHIKSVLWLHVNIRTF